MSPCISSLTMNMPASAALLDACSIPAHRTSPALSRSMVIFIPVPLICPADLSIAAEQG
jgi:hypothetical protein